VIFWDADLWMHPGLLTISPSHASTITNYRLKLADQAAENAKLRNKAGLAYPWTSGRYGDCTGTGPCFDYQYHLNTDIALSLWHTYCQTGNLTWLKEEAWDVIKGITDFMTDIVHKNETTNGKYWLTNMTDPYRMSMPITLIMELSLWPVSKNLPSMP
jgi:trehalose/maltose hydrolase-like predicted phosphorylase